METILTAFIIITILLFASLTLFHDYLAGQDTIRASWQEMEERLGEQARTDLSPVAAEVKSIGSVVELTLRNDGDTKLADFDHWDVVVQHYAASGNYHIDWYSYVSGSPSGNEWTVVGIYTDAATATSELYEPDILNPGEEVVLRLSVSPPVGPGTTNQAMLSVANGVTAFTFFTR